MLRSERRSDNDRRYHPSAHTAFRGLIVAVLSNFQGAGSEQPWPSHWDRIEPGDEGETDDKPQVTRRGGARVHGPATGPATGPARNCGATGPARNCGARLSKAQLPGNRPGSQLRRAAARGLAPPPRRRPPPRRHLPAPRRSRRGTPIEELECSTRALCTP
jgi:hypothetical protein